MVSEKRVKHEIPGRRVKTGVPGLDELVAGGFPSESVVLVSGTAGTGKTIMALQFLINGAKRGERGVYFTFEEREDKIRDQCRQFGWPIDKLEKQNKLLIKSIHQKTIDTVFGEIKGTLDAFKPTRMALDSITTFSLYAHTVKKVTDVEAVGDEEAIYGTNAEICGVVPPEWGGVIVRHMLVTLVQMLQLHRITALVTSEMCENSNWYSRDTLSEFACDGLIVLKSVALGEELHRTIEVRKMRNTPIKGGVYELDFYPKGVRVSGSGKK